MKSQIRGFYSSPIMPSDPFSRKAMNTKIWISFTFIALQLSLVALPYIPKLLPTSPSTREQLDWQIRIVSSQFALLTAYLGILFLLRERENTSFQEKLVSFLPETRVKKLRDDDFYSAFLQSARMAKSVVNIMYLAAYPPDDVQDLE